MKVNSLKENFSTIGEVIAGENPVKPPRKYNEELYDHLIKNN
jgi:hypothetical protein